MAVVKLEECTLSIDAAVTGRGLNVEPSLVQVRMREGHKADIPTRSINVRFGGKADTGVGGPRTMMSLRGWSRVHTFDSERWLSLPLRC